MVASMKMSMVGLVTMWKDKKSDLSKITFLVLHFTRQYAASGKATKEFDKQQQQKELQDKLYIPISSIQ